MNDRQQPIRLERATNVAPSRGKKRAIRQLIVLCFYRDIRSSAV